MKFKDLKINDTVYIVSKTFNRFAQQTISNIIYYRDELLGDTIDFKLNPPESGNSLCNGFSISTEFSDLHCKTFYNTSDTETLTICLDKKSLYDVFKDRIDDAKRTEQYFDNLIKRIEYENI